MYSVCGYAFVVYEIRRVVFPTIPSPTRTTKGENRIRTSILFKLFLIPDLRGAVEGVSLSGLLLSFENVSSGALWDAETLLEPSVALFVTGAIGGDDEGEDFKWLRFSVTDFFKGEPLLINPLTESKSQFTF